MFAKSLNSIFHLNPLLESNSIAKWTFFRQFATQSKYFNVAFFGSDNVSLPTLKALYEDSLKPDGVVNKLEVVCTSSEKSKGKGKKPKKSSKASTLLPVETFCKENQIQYNPLPPMKSMKEWTVPTQFLEHQYNIIVCASFGYFIPSSVLNLFEHSGINVHPSLLPKYRGPSPIISTLLNGDNCTGVSIITLDPKKIDEGGMLYQKQVNISNTIMCPELTDQLATLGSECLMHTLYHYDELMQAMEPQDPLLPSSTTQKVTSEMSIVSFENTSTKIYNQFRAISHLFPLKCKHIHTKINDNQTEETITNTIILRDLYVPTTAIPLQQEDSLSSLPVGTVKYLKRTKHMYIKCGNNTWLGVKALQIMPKSITIPAHVFVNQYKGKNLFTTLDS